MKKMVFSIIVFFAFYLSICNTHAQHAYKIFNKLGKVVDLNEIVNQSTNKAFIFFGEYHNDPISHWLQLELTKSLHSLYGKNLILGAEMFEADVQLVMDEYMAGLINSASFEKESRIWPNYITDYKAIIDYCKSNQIKVVATNIPRRYANAVYHKGIASLLDLSDHAKSYIAPLPIVPDTTISSYSDLMKTASGHNNKNLMEAQAVKDATMAYFILNNSSANSVFLHLNGTFHSDNGEGILSFLSKNVEADKILTITTVVQNQQEKLEPKNEKLADFIICVNANMTKTH